MQKPFQGRTKHTTSACSRQVVVTHGPGVLPLHRSGRYNTPDLHELLIGSWLHDTKPQPTRFEKWTQVLIKFRQN